MLKAVLFDCAINEKYCSDDGGWGICPLFPSPPRGIWQLKSPHPREFAIKGKNNANARGSARGKGAGRSWNWLMHYFLAQLELTDALLSSVFTQCYRTTIKSFTGTYNYHEVKPHPILNTLVTPGIIRFGTRLSLFTETLIVVVL